MLFAEPIKLQNILPWVIVALAVVMIVAILSKSFATYRNIKKNKNHVKQDDQPKEPLMTIRGEYFVLQSNCAYSVGEGGQLKSGAYLLRGDGYDKFELTVSGETKQINGDSVVTFFDGDVLTPLTCDLLIKPFTDTKETK